jgi:hypothetical protein
MNANELSPAARPSKLTLKGILVVFLCSLVFAILALSMVAGVFEETMFRQRAAARIGEVQKVLDQGAYEKARTDRELVQIEIDHEKALMDRYIVFAGLAALALALLAAWRVGRSRSKKRFFLLMTIAGFALGLSLAAIYGALHARILPGGLQDPGFRKALVACMFGLCALDGLIVAWIALRMARPKARKAAA